MDSYQPFTWSNANMTLDMAPRYKRKLDIEDDCEKMHENKRYNNQNLPELQLPSLMQESLHTPPLFTIEQPMYIPHQMVFPVTPKPAPAPAPVTTVPAITLASPDYKPPPAITFASPDYRPPPAFLQQQQQAYQQRMLAQQAQQAQAGPPPAMIVDTEMGNCGGDTSGSDSEETRTPTNQDAVFFGATESTTMIQTEVGAGGNRWGRF